MATVMGEITEPFLTTPLLLSSYTLVLQVAQSRLSMRATRPEIEACRDSPHNRYAGLVSQACQIVIIYHVTIMGSELIG